MNLSFGAMLLQVHKEFANQPAMALDEAMKARVLEWSEREIEEQARALYENATLGGMSRVYLDGDGMLCVEALNPEEVFK